MQSVTVEASRPPQTQSTSGGGTNLERAEELVYSLTLNEKRKLRDRLIEAIEVEELHDLFDRSAK